MMNVLFFSLMCLILKWWNSLYAVCLQGVVFSSVSHTNLMKMSIKSRSTLIHWPHDWHSHYFLMANWWENAIMTANLCTTFSSIHYCIHYYYYWLCRNATDIRTRICRCHRSRALLQNYPPEIMYDVIAHKVYPKRRWVIQCAYSAYRSCYIYQAIV